MCRRGRLVGGMLGAALFFLAVPAGHAGTPKPYNPASPPTRPSLYGQVAIELLNTPEEKINIGEAALCLSTLILTGERYDKELAQLDEIAARVARAIKLKGRDDPEFRITALASVLHGLGYHFSWDDMEGVNPENSLLLSVLRTKKGNCVGLPTLWYAVAERLGFPIYAVMAPSHVFLRYDDGKFRTNLETTSYSNPTDEEMIADLETPKAAIASGAEMRSLSKRELLAALISNIATRIRNTGISIELEQDALTAFPNSIQSHWNLAIDYSRMAFIELHDGEILARRDGKSTREITMEARLALQHAVAATKLGASKPLEKEYWKRVSAFGEKKAGEIKPASQPFDVTSLVMRSDARLNINWQWIVDPVLYERAVSDPESCARICATFCEPAPENLCAENLRRRGLRR